VAGIRLTVARLPYDGDGEVGCRSMPDPAWMGGVEMTENRELRLPTGELISMIRTGPETEGRVFEFEAILPAGLSGPPAHWHRVGQETFEVVEGMLRVRVGRAVRHLGPGESIVVPPGIVHTFSNPTGQQVRVITRETPAGQLEAQLRVMVSAGRLPPLIRLAEVNAMNGFSFFLAGLPEFPQRLLWHGLAGLARTRKLWRSSSREGAAGVAQGDP
jgi:mannose-6-phosphate isomerase-like protein (cupin superfamily)